MSVYRATWDQIPANDADRKGADSATILFVEGEVTVRKLVARLLALNRYRVFSADNGRRAVALWERHCNEIDLLLTGVALPDGLAGQELADTFQAEKPSLKVIYTSGHSLGFASEEECVATENNFMKAYRPEQILAAVQDAIQNYSKPGTVC